MTQTPDTLSARLKAETRESHVHAEKSLNIMSPDITTQDYILLLRRWLGFYRVWELIAAKALVQVDADFWSPRNKSENLLADLTALDPTRSPDVPLLDPGALSTTSLAGVLGVLYVTEGATLGGRYIAKHLETKLGVTSTYGGRFFTGYGDLTAQRWAETKALLDWASVPPDEVIASATRTFNALAEWLPRRE